MSPTTVRYNLRSLPKPYNIDHHRNISRKFDDHKGSLDPLQEPCGEGITCDCVSDLRLSGGFGGLFLFVDGSNRVTHLVPCVVTTNTPTYPQVFRGTQHSTQESVSTTTAGI